MSTYTIYVGANNKTKELELEAIERVLANRHKGFTIYQAIGYWLGNKENTAVITVSDDQALITATIADLKRELEQDAIGYQVAPELNFF